MGVARYGIFGAEGAWQIRHDGKADNKYATKEAAFEAAIAAASLALRQGHEVVVTAPRSGQDRAPALIGAKRSAAERALVLA
jgi:predicted kinase